MNEPNFEQVARRFLVRERITQQYNIPKPIRAIVKWRNGIYVGSIQEVVPEYSREIVLLSKTSYPLPDSLITTIKKLDSERIDLDADASLDLEGRQHILRKLENKLIAVTSEQTEYMEKHKPEVFEL